MAGPQGPRRRGEKEATTDHSALTRPEQIELLMHEYDAISEQIVHWDSQLWQKSQFFVAVEAASLGIVAQWLLPTLQGSTQANGAQTHTAIAGIVCLASAVNLFLCYSWFRTGRSNLEYSATRAKRARQIEDEPVLANTLQLYRQADAYLRGPSAKNHSSSWWVRHIPSAFILAWIVVLGTGAAIALSQPSVVWPEVAAPVAVAITALTAMALGEVKGWPAGGSRP